MTIHPDTQLHALQEQPAPSYADLQQRVRELEAWEGKARQVLAYFRVACLVHNWPKQSKAIDDLFKDPGAPGSG